MEYVISRHAIWDGDKEQWYVEVALGIAPDAPVDFRVYREHKDQAHTRARYIVALLEKNNINTLKSEYNEK